MGRTRYLPALAATVLTTTVLAAIACGGGNGATPAATGTRGPAETGTAATQTPPASSPTPASASPTAGTATPTPAGAAVQSPTGTGSPATAVTATPTPAGATTTPVPAAATTPPPSGGLAFRNTSTYTEPDGQAYVIVGEVVNNGPQDLHYLELKVRLYDASGAVLREDYGIAMFEIVPANGGLAPFEAYIVDPPANIARFDIAFASSEPPSVTGSRPGVGLDLAVSSLEVDEDDLLIITGTVTNNSPHTYAGVRPVFAFYSAAGAVVRVTASFVDVETLRPGATASFEAVVFDASTWTYARYQGWADAVIEP
jgi:hypothetical protein